MAEQTIAESLLGSMKSWVEKNHSQQPTLLAEAKAMTREAIKDIRGTIHEVFFGQPEHASEMGTPLNPTPGQTTKDLMGDPMTKKEETIANTLLTKEAPQQEMQQGMDGREM